MSYIIDTNVLIDLYRGRLPAECAKKVARLFGEGDCVLSIVTQAELLSLSTITEEEKQFIYSACSKVKILDFNAGYLDDVIAIRSARKIRLPDEIIAGIARKHKMTIIAANINDLSNILGFFSSAFF